MEKPNYEKTKNDVTETGNNQNNQTNQTNQTNQEKKIIINKKNSKIPK